METANGGGGNKLPNKEQTMITTLEQHCGKCLDAIIIGSIIQCSMICFLILVAIAIVIKIDKKWTDDNCIVQFVQLVALSLVSEYSVHIFELFQRVSDSEALYLESNSHEMLFCVKQRKD